MLFFSMLQENGTLTKVSRKMTAICGKNGFPLCLCCVEDGDLVMTKDYDDNGIWVNFTHRPIYHQNIRFKNEKQMRRAGQCLIDLARIGGNEVEIKDEEK